MHVRHNFNLSPQAEDKDIYNLAVKNRMFVVTMDYDFKKFVRKGCPGAFLLHAGLTNLEIDTAILNFIHGKNPEDYYGKIIKISVLKDKR